MEYQLVHDTNSREGENNQAAAILLPEQPTISKNLINNYLSFFNSVKYFQFVPFTISGIIWTIFAFEDVAKIILNKTAKSN